MAGISESTSALAIAFRASASYCPAIRLASRLLSVFVDLLNRLPVPS